MTNFLHQVHSGKFFGRQRGETEIFYCLIVMLMLDTAPNVDRTHRFSPLFPPSDHRSRQQEAADLRCG